MEISTTQYFKKIAVISKFPKEFTRAEIEAASIHTINVWDIHTQQETMDTDHIAKTKNRNTPLAIRLNGMLILIDGHHRIAKKMNANFRQVKVKVLEL